jgi:hypothetical protein
MSKFAVLVAGWPPSSVVKAHGGGYGAMITRLLRESGEEWREIDCEDGREIPTSDELDGYEGASSKQSHVMLL